MVKHCLTTLTEFLTIHKILYKDIYTIQNESKMMNEREAKKDNTIHT